MQKHIDTFFTRYPRKSIRALEMALPLTSIMLITLPFWGAFLFPTVLAYLIIFFDIWWLYKSFNFARCAYISTRIIKKTEKIDWNERASKLKNYDKVLHMAIFPNYKEPIEIIAESIETIRHQSLPSKKIIIVLAMEEREEEAVKKAEALKERFGKHFWGFYYTLHPDLPNEVKGKSSNQAYAAVYMNKILEEKGVDIDFLTVSSVDADSKFDPQFFANLTYTFLTVENPYYSFFQSANVHYNNFWDVPAFTRVIAFFGSLWRTALLVQGMRLLPNSTYTLSFKLLRDIGYWDVDVIPEDYRVFFKAFFATKGKAEVHPIFLKTSMDSAHGQTYTKSLYSRYSQERRWAWGISDDAVYLKWWFTVTDVPFIKKTYLLSGVLVDHILWPVYWYIITIAANAVVFLNPVFFRTSLGYTLPRLSGFVLTVTLLSLVIMIYTDYILRTKNHPNPPSRLRQFLFPLEFVLMPITGFFLSSFPALITHIQLIIGKRLEYKVTEKISK